jgi:hypothetical protein
VTNASDFGQLEKSHFSLPHLATQTTEIGKVNQVNNTHYAL